MIAPLLKCSTWEHLIRYLSFLDAENIYSATFQPIQHMGQARTNGVDIPGGNFHEVLTNIQAIAVKKEGSNIWNPLLKVPPGEFESPSPP